MLRRVREFTGGPAGGAPSPRIRGGAAAIGLALGAACMLASSALAASCTSSGLYANPSARTHKLYLYFPTAADSAYPEFGGGGAATSPANPFDVSGLPSLQSTSTDELRNAILGVVLDTFCEFDVEVLLTTSPPPTTPANRSTVAIGTDAPANPSSDDAFGTNKLVDTGDLQAVDFARVWAGLYQTAAGGTGGELQGAKSKLERWARAIGGTVAHEAGHGYGLSHGDGITSSHEDSAEHHLMGPGSHYTLEQRAGYRRHFSDWEYSMLASTVGMAVQSMQTWEVMNPNMQTTGRADLHVLSLQSNLTPASVYLGDHSPWQTPTVTLDGTVSFRGSNYNHYVVSWSTPQKWNGGADGRVPGGARFTLGISFTSPGASGPTDTVYTSMRLYDEGGNLLELEPRLPVFDSGQLVDATGTFELNVWGPADSKLRVEGASVELLPRLVSIEALATGSKRRSDAFGIPVAPWETKRLPVTPEMVGPRAVPFRIARLADGFTRIQVVRSADCRRAIGWGPGRDAFACNPGVVLSLFPATAVVLTATFVSEPVQQWDPRGGRYTRSPQRTTVRHQFVGRRPSLELLLRHRDHQGVSPRPR